MRTCKHPRILVACSFVAMFATGCGLETFQPGRPMSDPALARRSTARMANALPDSFEATHRGLLEIRGYEILFTCHSFVTPSKIRLVGVGDFGKSLFVIDGTVGQRPTVLQTIGELFEPDYLERFVWRALHAALLRPSPRGGQLHRSEAGEIQLIVPGNDKLARVFLLDTETGLINSCLFVEGKMIYASAVYGRWQRLTDWARAVPTSTVFEHHRIGHKLTLELISIKPKQ